jgi:hypothetical protein
MSKMLNRLAATLIAATTAVTACAAIASTFFAWQVTGVSGGDVLMVRAYPSTQSQIIVGYPSGVTLSLTGRCTGGVDLNGINGRPSWFQRQAVRSVWCEVWLDPYATGDFRNGWVYGGYIRPL